MEAYLGSNPARSRCPEAYPGSNLARSRCPEAYPGSNLAKSRGPEAYIGSNPARSRGLTVYPEKNLTIVLYCIVFIFHVEQKLIYYNIQYSLIFNVHGWHPPRKIKTICICYLAHIITFIFHTSYINKAKR